MVLFSACMKYMLPQNGEFFTCFVQVISTPHFEKSPLYKIIPYATLRSVHAVCVYHIIILSLGYYA